MPKNTKFDAADYLDNEERQAAYMAAALDSGDADFVRDSLDIVARARGVARPSGTPRSGGPGVH